MEFFPDDDVIKFAEFPSSNNEERSIVPSPLKSCYAAATTYDDLVEYSDLENSSGEEHQTSEQLRSNNSGNNNGYRSKKSVVEYITYEPIQAYPRQVSPRAVKKRKEKNTVVYHARKRIHERAKGKTHVEEDVNFEELMMKFKKAREIRFARFQKIYEESRKRVDEVMENLKQTMTENGHREWFPKVR